MKNYLEKNPLLVLIIALVTMFILLDANTQTATIEKIDGKDWITAIDGKPLEFPRRPSRDDLDLKWIRK